MKKISIFLYFLVVIVIFPNVNDIVIKNEPLNKGIKRFAHIKNSLYENTYYYLLAYDLSFHKDDVSSIAIKKDICFVKQDFNTNKNMIVLFSAKTGDIYKISKEKFISIFGPMSKNQCFEAKPENYEQLLFN